MPVILGFCCALFTLSLIFLGHDDQIKVRFLQALVRTQPGQLSEVKVLITNQSPRDLILTGHLELPGGWNNLPWNNLLTRIGPFQNNIQNFLIKVPGNAPAGTYQINYVAVNRDNINVQDCDDVVFQVYRSTFAKSMHCCHQIIKEKVASIENTECFARITSPLFLEADPGEIIFISALINNPGIECIRQRMRLGFPGRWNLIVGSASEIEISPRDSAVQIFGLKIPDNALAQNYTIAFETEGAFRQQQIITVRVKPKIEFFAELLNPCEFYPSNVPIDLALNCVNKGNAPLTMQVNAVADPCCKLYYFSKPFTIPPRESCVVPLQVHPQLVPGEFKQFIHLKARDVHTCELVCQQSLCLDLARSGVCEDDLLVRIPAYFKAIALGDNNRHVLAGEFGGCGVIDPCRNRTLEFVFRVPTTTKNVIYNVDQRLFLGIQDPEWDLELGDTVYCLTPLTQRYRYGRGAGFNLYKKGCATGFHYTQNTFNNDYNPKEVCGYIEFFPTPYFRISGNYLNKTLPNTPCSNIVTIASEFEYPGEGCAEIEVGRNFIAHVDDHDKYAYRFHTEGRCMTDTWYDVEKIYAGSVFYGYYQHIDSFSTTVDFPICPRLRGNLNQSYLKQYYNNIYCNDTLVLSPRQRQFNANLVYSLLNGATITLNALLLRAKDDGVTHQYNFFQKWGGLSLSIPCWGYSFYSNISFGQQKDYQTGRRTSFLQKYYGILSKELTPDLYASIFYEAGNINYYDARPWRAAYGGSLRYRYGYLSCLELFAQKVNHTPDQYNLSQVSLCAHHTFKSCRSLDVSVQYFHYRQHYPNDFMFLVSYNIPLGLPVGRRKDVGSISGCVYDAWQRCPVPNAVVNLNEGCVLTDAQGRFSFSRVPVGEQLLKTEVLPQNFIPQCPPGLVKIHGGRNTQVAIPVLPACTIEGSITLCKFDGLSEEGQESLVEEGGLEGIRVYIDQGKNMEVISCLTDKNGRFHFSNMPPGRWRIRVDEENLPKMHYLDANNFIIAVNAKEEKSLYLKVIPIRRTIQSLE